MSRLTACLYFAFAAGALAGCGRANPLPVPETQPTAAVSSPAPQREPPPSSLVVATITELSGICGHSDLWNVAQFQGHFDGWDGTHYHGWEPPMSEPFWVMC